MLEGESDDGQRWVADQSRSEDERWPAWVLVPVLAATTVLLVAVVVAATFIYNRATRDDRGLQRVESRVRALLGDEAVLVDKSTNTYRIPGRREVVEAELLRRFRAEGLLYPAYADPAGDNVIPLQTGPRYYAEIHFVGDVGETTTFTVVTTVED